MSQREITYMGRFFMGLRSRGLSISRFRIQLFPKGLKVCVYQVPTFEFDSVTITYGKCPLRGIGEGPGAYVIGVFFKGPIP